MSQGRARFAFRYFGVHSLPENIANVRASNERCKLLMTPSHDSAMRLAAFNHLRRLGELRSHLTSADLSAGFFHNDQRVPLINPPRDIFKPKAMRFLRSVKTVFPKTRARVWYDDQRDVHRQIYQGDDAIDHSFIGRNAEAERCYALRTVKQRPHQATFMTPLSTRTTGGARFQDYRNRSC